MDKATLKALKGSIRKWEGIVAGTEVDDGLDNCPLCQKFEPTWVGGCGECPVAKVGGDGCVGTPYDDWTAAFEEKGEKCEWPKKATDDETVMCAVLELEFLKSLLPSKRSRK